MVLMERARVSGMCARCLGHGRRAVHTAQLPRSILFEPPYVEDGPGPQTQSFRSRHRAQLREEQKASQSSSEKAVETEALRDPWCKSPMGSVVPRRETSDMKGPWPTPLSDAA